jgi:hypothetical protein
MRTSARVRQGRLRGWTQGQDTEQGPGSGTADSDPAPHEPLSPGGSSARGQLIDMGDWRLLPPLDLAVGGAA